MLLFFVKIFSTHPTPIVFALTASHVHAPRIFLDWDFAIRASMSSNYIGPPLIKLFLCLVTWLSLVPFSCTIKAHISFASSAFYFLRILGSLYNLLAWRIRAEFLIIWDGNFMIFSKLLELLKSFRIYNILYHVFCNHFAAALLRAFESMTLPWLLDLILKEIFIGSPAKLVAALFLGNEKFAFWVVIIADLAKNLPSCLKVFFFFYD